MIVVYIGVCIYHNVINAYSKMIVVRMGKYIRPCMSQTSEASVYEQPLVAK